MGCTHSNEQTIINTSQQQLSEQQIQELTYKRFNRSEILDWYRVFNEKCGIDDNSSFAYINKSIFINYFNQLHPNGDVTRLTEYFFQIYDINNDGFIDFMEFMDAISIIRRGITQEKLSWIFFLFISNRQGFLDRFKLGQMMEALYNLKGINYKDNYNILLKKVDYIITRIDKNQEGGKISVHQFIESCMNDPALKNVLNI